LKVPPHARTREENPVSNLTDYRPLPASSQIFYSRLS
jgi:hypothetical protein